MPIHVNLTESDWKANGLTKRTLSEKLNSQKTMISEALRVYAALDTDTAERTADKAQALQNIRIRLTAAKASHRGNAPFLAHLAKMEQAVRVEVEKINAGINALSLAAILATPALYRSFLVHCTKQHDQDDLEFLRVAFSMPRAILVRTFIDARSPKELNIDEPMLKPLRENPADTEALTKIYNQIQELVEHYDLQSYKQGLKVHFDALGSRRRARISTQLPPQPGAGECPLALNGCM